MEAILTHKISETILEDKFTVEGFVYDEPPIESEHIKAHTIYKLYKNDKMICTLVNPLRLDQSDLIAECAKLLNQPKLFM